MTAVRLLSDRHAAELTAQPFTYPEIGRTQGPLPDGYHHVRRTRRLSNSVDFESVADTLGGPTVTAPTAAAPNITS